MRGRRCPELSRMPERSATVLPPPAKPSEPRSCVRARTVAEWAPPKKRKHRPPSDRKGLRERYAREVEGMRQEGDWAALEPGHAVALYAACHERCYGVAPLELEHPKDFALARIAAKRLLLEHFEGKAETLASFVRWCWEREQEREQWRRQNGRTATRIGWRLQFGAALVTEFRIAGVRHRNGAAR